MSSFERHVQAMDKINAWIGVRERTCSELLSRLQRNGFSEEEAHEAVDSAVSCGLVDETRYTRMFISSKVRAGWGKGKIIAHLNQSGISADIIDACSDEFPSRDADVDRAIAELAKRSTSSSDPYAAYMRRLIGKGYSTDVSREAVRRYLSME